MWRPRTHRWEATGVVSANSKPLLLMVKDVKLQASEDLRDLRGHSLEFVLWTMRFCRELQKPQGQGDKVQDVSAEKAVKTTEG